MICFTAMCLRSVHSLHLHSVQALRSFRFASFTTLSFTAFRLRSFHQPQHRTAKAIPSLHSAKPTHRLSVSWRLLNPRYNSFCFLKSYKSCQRFYANCSCHYKPPTRFAPFPSVIAFALDPPHHRKRYALFFPANCLPQPTHKT